MAKSTSVALIDYGMGNLHSAAKALQKSDVHAKIHVTSDPNLIKTCDRIVLPGVGAMRDCMAAMIEQGIDQLVLDQINQKPFLGICVGMQSLLQSSEENGGVNCLGHFEGRVLEFSKTMTEHGERLKVPHMGWNQVSQSDHPIWHGIEDQSRFYFVHSFYVALEQKQQQIGQCHYGHDFSAAIAKDNVVAVQFHPEKSSKVGLKLLDNFMKWNGEYS